VSIIPTPLIAGIGASAGGIEALQAFFEALPEKVGVGFVVVVHLSPEHRSMLPAIIAARTSMRVDQVTDTMPLEANRVYVIPPDRRLQITDNSIAALPFDEPRGRRAPIDLFFRSLAERHGDGFGVILSGGGTDGALGVKAIKEGGGLVLVQDPAEAKHDSMPRAAIATHVADVVLPVRDLARQLADFAHAKRRIRHLIQPKPSGLLDAENEAMFGRILGHLHARTGHDFSKYKRGTVLRRLARRMQVQRKETLADYYAHLRERPEESSALFADLLISVTTFFRDPESWQALVDSVLPKLFEESSGDSRIRVWAPGCATGEEAYTLAILILEEAHRREMWPEVQIFATDLDQGALAVAREGRYPKTIAADVSEERLRKFFREEGDQYAVTKEVRDCVLFTTHSLLRDPPFSRLDLVSCRNLLIYLDRELQQQVFGVFRYALRPGRFLFLGASETVGGRDFRPIDKKHHLYQVREAAGDAPRLPELLLLTTPRVRFPELPNVSRTEPPPPGVMHRQLLEGLAPPSILVDDERNAVHLSETVGRFLQPPAGPLTRDVTRLVRSELQAELRSALCRAIDRGEATLTPFLSVQADGVTPRRVAMLVRPANDGGERRVLVMFIEGGPADVPEVHTSNAAPEAARELEAELQQTRERLSDAREQFEAGNEELRATNEELQSINEEYRSTAEELETSKEELQSINEELETVNGELKAKLQEVSRAHSDLQNLMAATEIGTLFLDRSLRIGRFTQPVAGLFNITESDRGRSIGDFSHQLDYAGLEHDARMVLKWLRPVEREARAKDGRSFLVRLTPYQARDGRIDGVVVTFVDFTARREAEEALRRSEERYRLLVDGVEEYAMVMLDRDGHITMWNSGAKKLFGRTEEETVGQPFAVLFSEDDRTAGVPARELAIAEKNGASSDDRWHARKDGARFWASGVTTALRDANGQLRGFAKVLRDNTDRQAAEAARLHFRSLFESAPGLYLVLRPEDFTIVAASDTYLHSMRTRREEILGRTLFDVIPDDPSDPDADGVRNLRASLEHVKATGRADVMAVQRYPVRRPAGDGGQLEERWWSPVNSPVPGPTGEIAYIIHRVEDVTPFIRQMIAEARESEAHQLLESRAQHMETEIVLRAQELQRANDEARGLRDVGDERAARSMLPTGHRPA
jgi:two-component system CheB/CheR fusion protein